MKRYIVFGYGHPYPFSDHECDAPSCMFPAIYYEYNDRQECITKKCAEHRPLDK